MLQPVAAVAKVLPFNKENFSMALSSFEMNTLVYLENEQRSLKLVNGDAKERWRLNDNEMSVVEKWFENRIQELINKKEN